MLDRLEVLCVPAGSSDLSFHVGGGDPQRGYVLTGILQFLFKRAGPIVAYV